MDPDDDALVVDVRQLGVASNIHLGPRFAAGGRHRVEGVAVGDVVVGMNRGRAPVGHGVGLAVVGQQVCPLLLLEDHQRQPPGGAVDPMAGHLQAPPARLRPQVRQVAKVGNLKEPFPGGLKFLKISPAGGL